MSAVLATPSALAPPTAPRARVSAHRLTAHALEQAGQLMAFNWLVAAHAHAEWLGPWAPLLEPRDQVDVRLLRRASLTLLARHGLRDRYLPRVGEYGWLLVPPEALYPVAHELGVAMLGGWIRNSLERTQVAQQLRLLAPSERSTAMTYANTLKALPYAPKGKRWRLARLEPSAVFELGVACLAALLTDERTGSKLRFLMRFAPGVVRPLTLTPAQRDEALALVNTHLKLTPPRRQLQGVST